MLYNSRKELDDKFLFNDYFSGVYTSDFYRPEYDYEYILLAYNYEFSEKYLEFEKKLFQSTNVVDMYLYENNDIIVYVIEIPIDFRNDYDKIITQEYNTLSPELKMNIFKMWSLNGSDTLSKILVGKEEYEGEVFEEEILKIN
jgi:hypothetical protein